MIKKKTASDQVTILLAVLLSGLIWAIFIKIHQACFDFSYQTKGIDLIFIPAGVRLGLIMLFRWWGALGITLSNLFVFNPEFETDSFAEVALISAIAGFIPMAAVLVTLRVISLDHRLESLQHYHLQLLSVVAALSSAIAHNIAFVALGYQVSDEWLVNMTMMALGDFIGCFVVLFLMWSAIKLYRSSKLAR